MSFTAPAEHYDRFMGRYTASLAPAFLEAVPVDAGARVVDVGCGPGGLTVELAARVGAANVAAIDPAPQFADACRSRVPEADVRVGAAEELPWDDDAFDAALSSLVVAFMSDADAGLREMARVTRPGGTVAACMWDLEGGGMTMLATFWKAVGRVQPGTEGERMRPGGAEGDIAQRLERVGLDAVESGAITARAQYTGFDDFWTPFTLAVGPAGEHLRSLPDADRDAVREACRELLPDGPFALDAKAWYARGTVPG